MTTATSTATWTVEMRFEEDTNHTQAIATLRTPAGKAVYGHGQSRRNPIDRPITQIGEEVAGARALSNLAHELLEYAAGEIESNAHQSAR